MLTLTQKIELIKVLSKNRSLIDATNEANGSNADNLYKEYCGDKRLILGDLFIGDFRVSQKFGVNKANYIKYGLQGHDGVDFACPNGTKLIAPFDGIILDIKNSGKLGYGLHVKIWNKKNACVLYGHMKSVNVKLLQTVKAGQLIGLSDNTGNSTGPHLHLGLCLTNILGYRLNKNNGFLGWVNPQDSTIVKWVITNPKTAL
jgi:murein DD-endopeptidase MepM/ murein hydrolase activator NlpD